MTARDDNLFWGGAHFGMAFALAMMAIGSAMSGGYYEIFIAATVINFFGGSVCLKNAKQEQNQ